jgi:LysR family transcriptional regulator, glycine cleavage system transcriptional activator
MRRQLPPLNALLAFEAAARHGRMTLAAQELSVTPGAISRQVKNLEIWLGTPLFGGSKNNPELTEVGQSLWPVLRVALDQINSATQAARCQTDNAVTIACYNTLASKWLLPRLHDLSRTQPQLEIHLSSRADVDDARALNADVVIRAHSASDLTPAGWLSVPLFDEWLGPVASAAFIARTPFQAPNELGRTTRLAAATRPDAWPLWAAAQGVKLPTLENRYVYEHYYVAIEAALKGLGVCMTPWHLVADDVAAGRLLPLFAFVPSGREYVLLHRANARPGVRATAAWLKRSTTKQPPAHTGGQDTNFRQSFRITLK